MNTKSSFPISIWIKENHKWLIDQYNFSHLRFIIVFCLLHFLSATLSLPGSCTFLNVLSGSVFGFKKGVVIVYTITMMSGIFGYFIGRNISFKFLEKKIDEKIGKLKNIIHSFDYFHLILIRLSPFLPYGVLNFLMGYLRVPFPNFLFSTFVGIFFDVFLLNSAGAIFSGNESVTSIDKRMMAVIFLGLFISFYFVKLLMTKLEKFLVSNGNKN